MADNITRCPKCHTSFRITEAHLKSAKGAVRCGSCLNIFNAKDHLVSEHSADNTTTTQTAKPAAKAKAHNKALTNKPKTAANKKAVSPVTSAKSMPSDDDDILISDDMPLDDIDTDTDTTNSDADFNDNILYSKTFGSQDSNLFEREIIHESDDDEEKSDDSWALDLLESSDDEEDLPTFRKDTGTQTAISDDDIANYPGAPFSDDGYTPSGIHAAVEEAEINDGYENLNTEELQYELEEEMSKTGFHEPVFTAVEPSLEELETIAEDDYRNGHSPSHQFIQSIEPEPVEFSYKTVNTFWESKWLWVPASTVMAVLLFAQISWLQFNKLNKTEPYRAYYAVVCSLFGCQLPPLQDRANIHAVNLVVRSHPKQSNALVVDAVLQNAAPFAQSFPSLDLIFTDVQNKAIAARRFVPSEYLGGEMAGKNSMPSKQPIHIALEITDPGPQAVGYRIVIAN
ncbi:MJ0042 family finger-like domain-containing protein [Alteromonadaceae bacterium Bs31]|nr:MJ0042 family finger-like domain-containing protein [Alteromonadaceae bacterium Bs31]